MLRAERDLEEIVDYLGTESGLARAESVLIEILDSARRLAWMPGMGHRREDLTDRPVRFWLVHSYWLIYRPETRPLEFVRVISVWRDVAGMLASERDE